MEKKVLILDFGEVFTNENTDPLASSVSGFGSEEAERWVPRFGKKKGEMAHVAFILGWSSVNSSHTLISRDKVKLAKDSWPFLVPPSNENDNSVKAPIKALSIIIGYTGQAVFSIPELSFAKAELKVNELLFDQNTFTVNGTTLIWKGKFFLTVEDKVTLLIYW